MKILVFSDSHGQTADMVRIIGSDTDAKAIIFLGDYINDIFSVQSLHPDQKYFAVAGNCDWASRHPDEELIELGGIKIFLTHGHRYGVKSGLAHLSAHAQKLGAVAAFFGHTHIAYFEKQNGIILLNPGSVTEPRGHIGRSYAVVNIENGLLRADLRLI